ncbi:MAG: adenosylhomocysteinase, partial [Chloroflexi bacterium]|nr:adenosylhomocysteinase [Chloroflexota bacterium]
ANAGHFNVESDVEELERRAETKRRVRPFVDEYTLENGRRINLLAEGRLVNLSAAEGHPSSVMDMSFANQALAAEYIIANRDTLTPDVHTLPSDLDAEIARIKLQSIGMPIDALTEEQSQYLASWEMGTA